MRNYIYPTICDVRNSYLTLEFKIIMPHYSKAYKGGHFHLQTQQLAHNLIISLANALKGQVETY